MQNSIEDHDLLSLIEDLPMSDTWVPDLLRPAKMAYYVINNKFTPDLGKIILKMILDQIKIIFSKTILDQIKIIFFQRNDLDLRS
jgi:hypothetical protein